MHSIRAKIALLIVMAILTSIVTLGGISLYELKKEIDLNSVEKMTLLSEKMQQQLNSYFSSVEQSVEMGIHIANGSLSGFDLTLFLSSRTPEETQRLNSLLREHCQVVENAFSSIADNTSGIVSYFYCLNDALGSSERGFFRAKYQSADFVSLEPPLSSELDMNDAENTVWYYAPLKAAAPLWVGPYTAELQNGQTTISYVAPIYCHGFLIGVLGMGIPLRTITDQMNAQRIYRSGYLYLMDSEGTVIYHPYLRRGATPEEYGIDLDTELFRRSSSGDALIRYTMDGQKWQLAFSTLRNKVKLGVIVPVGEINASQYRLTTIFLTAAGLILSFFSFATAMLVHKLTQPLQALASASTRLMQGDYKADLDYDGNDELGIVTRSFRQMRSYFKLYISELNSRAYDDALTGVKNRAAFTLAESELNRELLEGRKPVFAILSFDCNDLKRINDSYGHDRGDLYIRRACGLICLVFSGSEVFRLGGDEFGVIMRGKEYARRDALLAEFDRVLAAYREDATAPWEKVSMARGMAVFSPGLDGSVEQVMSRADKEMYEDKRRYHSEREEELS